MSNNYKSSLTDISTELASIYDVINALPDEGSGGNTDIEDAFVTKTLTTYTNDRVSYIGEGAFIGQSNLVSVDFPICTQVGKSAFYNCVMLQQPSFPMCESIGQQAFYSCSQLTTINFPQCRSIGASAFEDCRQLNTINFPICTTIDGYAFRGCSSLTSINFPTCTTISYQAFAFCDSLASINFPACATIDVSAFSGCSKLTFANFAALTSIGQYAFNSCGLRGLVIGTSSVATLVNINAFQSTPISAGVNGYIYVPYSLVESYKSATNWTTYSDEIKGCELKSGEVIVSFTIDGTSYKTKLNMTWTEWCESTYNTGGFYVSNKKVLKSSYYAVYWGNSAVSASGTIVADVAYKTSFNM